MSPAELLRPELLAAALGGFLAQLFAALVVNPMRLKRMAVAAATEAVTAALRDHERTCPARNFLQPVGADLTPERE